MSIARVAQDASRVENLRESRVAETPLKRSCFGPPRTRLYIYGIVYTGACTSVYSCRLRRNIFRCKCILTACASSTSYELHDELSATRCVSYVLSTRTCIVYALYHREIACDMPIIASYNHNFKIVAIIAASSSACIHFSYIFKKEIL